MQVQKWWEASKIREQQEDWNEAIDLVNRILQKKPGGTMEAMAKQKLVYQQARRDAQTRFDAGDFKAAAMYYDQAYKLDPFSIDTAFQGVNSSLLNDQLDEAVRLLKAIRVRGTTEAISKANSMLKEIAAVYPEAGKELQAGIPAPPPVNEIFEGIDFGVPDFDAGKRFLSESPVDVGKYSEKLIAAVPVQPAQTAVAAAGTTGETAQEQGVRPNPDAFHLELELTGRNISISKTPETGTLALSGPDGNTEVAVNGFVKAKSVPAMLTLPAGTYMVKAVDAGGKVVNSGEVEIKASQVNTLSVKK